MAHSVDLNSIYNEGYSFSLPRSIMETYFDGKAFGGKRIYTPEDRQNIAEDIDGWYVQILSENPERDRVAVLTAGAPGSGKTYLMRQELDHQRAEKRHYAYLDPDDVFLREKAARTYLAQISQGDNTYETKLRAYEEWRAASNAATQYVLAKLISDGISFYYGTTSTAPQTGFFLRFLKDHGYKIKLLHVTAPDMVRKESVEARNSTFVQVAAIDVIEKGRLLPQRINDTFLKFADEIAFYFRSGVDQNAELGAVWKRNEADSKCLGKLKIVSERVFDEIKAVHREQCKNCKELGNDELYWERSLSEASELCETF